MKSWLTAQEIADLKLDGFPATKRGVNKIADREEWNASKLSRKRDGREGGGGMEYHIDLLPLPQRLAYAGSFVVVEDSDFLTEVTEDLSHRAERNRDARLIILRLAVRFRKQCGMGQYAANHLFCQLYDAGEVRVPDWVRSSVKRLSLRSLDRWKAEAAQNANQLSHDPAQSRKATGVLDKAFGGDLKTHLMGAIFDMPHLKAEPLRKMAKQRFGERLEIVNPETGEVTYRDLPPLRTFQHTLKRWREEYASAIKRHTDPDGWKNTDKFVMSGGASAGIVQLNQLWEIDASPVDMLTTEGRWNVYACIDIWSRRAIFLISCTPRADAVGLLIRDAILKWGVPQTIKSDNGSDFVANQTKRLLRSLGIEHDLCPPFSPEKKPHVERVIGTFQHSFVELLPGFVGHNVGERSVIEGRRAFARRLGISDYNVFNAEVSPDELQELATKWAEDVYAHRPHAGLKGMTPAAKAAQSAEEILTVDPKALDVLLAAIPSGNGLRTVGKKGIQVNHEYYMPEDWTIMPGRKVFCRMDPKDLGRLWVFDDEGEEFLGQAVCHHLVGADPQEVIAKQRALQKAYLDDQVAPIKKAMKEISARDALEATLNENRDTAQVFSFPPKQAAHATTRTLAAADVKKRRQPRALNEREAAMMESLKAEAAAPATTPNPQNNVRDFTKPDTPEALFQRALNLEQRLEEGTAISDEDAIWLARFKSGPIYRAHMIMREDTRERSQRVPPAS